jgi:hypothetical protein
MEPELPAGLDALASLAAEIRFAIFPRSNCIWGEIMPFSSLTDPVELARAQAALEAAWSEIQPTIAEENRERERVRLSYIIAPMLAMVEDHDEIVRRAVNRYLNSNPH